MYVVEVGLAVGGLILRIGISNIRLRICMVGGLAVQVQGE